MPLLANHLYTSARSCDDGGMGPIVCVCTGNICRSPMAERLLARALQEAGMGHLQVVSAGVGAYDGNPASSYSVQALQPLDIDLSNHRSQQLSQELLSSASLVLVMTEMHRLAIQEEYEPVATPIYLWRQFMPHHQQVSDPYGADYQSYVECRDMISEAVPGWVQWIKENLK